MKKITILAVCLFVVAISANAQVAVGVKGGLNFANQNFSESGLDAKSKTGFHAGAFATISLGGVVAIQPEILYSAQGGKFEVNTASGTQEFTNKFNYINIPILVRFDFAKILNVHAGPQFGFLASAEDEDGNDLKDFAKDSDLSLAVGAGVDLPLGIVGGIRYNLGLSDISDDGSNTEVKNNVFQIFVGYKLFGK